jgi:GntR family transcriptional repressor for pyruvate dehydrogenase complex
MSTDPAGESPHPRARDGSLVDTATNAIRLRIVDGTLRAGDRLPPERSLVEELSISRTVLREALSSLEALGLIETRGTRGRFVTAGGSSERSRTIVSAWLHQHAREILEIDEIRSVLEAHAIRSMTEWDAIDAARKGAAIIRRQEAAIRDGNSLAAAEADAAFHRLLGSYTQNTALRLLIEGLVSSTRRETLAVYSIPEASERSVRQHREIVAVLAASDRNAAAESARNHMMDAARRYATADPEPADE